MSAVGDVHRDFETEAQIGEARCGPLHGESPEGMVEIGGLIAADAAARGMPFVAQAEHDCGIGSKRLQLKTPPTCQERFRLSGASPRKSKDPRVPCHQWALGTSAASPLWAW